MVVRCDISTDAIIVGPTIMSIYRGYVPLSTLSSSIVNCPNTHKLVSQNYELSNNRYTDMMQA